MHLLAVGQIDQNKSGSGPQLEFPPTRSRSIDLSCGISASADGIKSHFPVAFATSYDNLQEFIELSGPVENEFTPCAESRVEWMLAIGDTSSWSTGKAPRSRERSASHSARFRLVPPSNMSSTVKRCQTTRTLGLLHLSSSSTINIGVVVIIVINCYH